MEPQENIKQFGSRLKDIIVLKDQVEDHLLNALEQAVSKDDLVKLNTTVVSGVLEFALANSCAN